MKYPAYQVEQLIVKELAGGEMRVLSLTVAVRRAIHRTRVFKGDLSATVRTALRKLVASRQVVESDGMYSLARVSHRAPAAAPGGDGALGVGRPRPSSPKPAARASPRGASESRG